MPNIFIAWSPAKRNAPMPVRARGSEHLARQTAGGSFIRVSSALVFQVALSRCRLSVARWKMVSLQRYDIVGIICAISGIAGLAAHSALYGRAGPVWVYPYFMGIWATIHITFFAWQIFYLQRRHLIRRERTADLILRTYDLCGGGAEWSGSSVTALMAAVKAFF